MENSQVIQQTPNATNSASVPQPTSNSSVTQGQQQPTGSNRPPLQPGRKLPPPPSDRALPSPPGSNSQPNLPTRGEYRSKGGSKPNQPPPQRGGSSQSHRGPRPQPKPTEPPPRPPNQGQPPIRARGKSASVRGPRPVSGGANNQNRPMPNPNQGRPMPTTPNQDQPPMPPSKPQELRQSQPPQQQNPNLPPSNPSNRARGKSASVRGPRPVSGNQGRPMPNLPTPNPNQGRPQPNLPPSNPPTRARGKSASVRGPRPTSGNATNIGTLNIPPVFNEAPAVLEKPKPPSKPRELSQSLPEKSNPPPKTPIPSLPSTQSTPSIQLENPELKNENEIPPPPPRSPENQRKPSHGTPPPLPDREPEISRTKSQDIQEHSRRERIKNKFRRSINIPLTEYGLNSHTYALSTEQKIIVLNEQVNQIKSRLADCMEQANAVGAEKVLEHYNGQLAKVTGELEALEALLKKESGPQRAQTSARSGARQSVIVQGSKGRGEALWAICSYTSVHPLQLSYIVGTMVIVLDKYPTGWWKGELNDAPGTVGFFLQHNFTSDPDAARQGASSPTFLQSTTATLERKPTPIPKSNPIPSEPVATTVQLPVTDPEPSISLQKQPESNPEPSISLQKQPEPVVNHTPVPVVTQPVSKPTPVARQTPQNVPPATSKPAQQSSNGNSKPAQTPLKQSFVRSDSNPSQQTPAPQPPVPQHPTAEAMYTFTQQNPTELPLTKGEIVYVIAPQGAWVYVKNQQGGAGYVPANYLRDLS